MKISRWFCQVSCLFKSSPCRFANSVSIPFTGKVRDELCIIPPVLQTISVTFTQNNKMCTYERRDSDALKSVAVFEDCAVIIMTYLNPEKLRAVVQVHYR